MGHTIETNYANDCKTWLMAEAKLAQVKEAITRPGQGRMDEIRHILSDTAAPLAVVRTKIIRSFGPDNNPIYPSIELSFSQVRVGDDVLVIVLPGEKGGAL